MKLATIRLSDGQTAAVLVQGDEVVELQGVRDVGALLADGGLASVPARATGAHHALAEADLAPVVPHPSKIICVGHNYRAHIAEMGREEPQHPVLFAKFADSLLGAGDDIPLPPESDAVDWECELGIVIGATVRRAKGADAAAAIAGYTICNDVSMRDWQFRTVEWTSGKIWDASTPLGPVLATPDEIPAEAHITTTVDGVEKQRGDIHDLVFDPAFLVEYVSTIITLNPGDVIISGTPGGVGHARDPKEYLKPGQTVTIAIDGIGELTNRTVAEVVAGVGAGVGAGDGTGAAAGEPALSGAAS